jgi:hypothetical protein
MIKIDLDIQDNITKDLERIRKSLPQIAKQGLAEYKRLTPVRSGNARRKTTVSGNAIQANYPYAGRLDEGYSKQAPKGMTEPFEQWLEKHISKIIKG